MQIEIKVPSVGESVTEAILAQWFKSEGDRITKDEPLFVIETDKVTLEVVAEADGILSITVAEGETVAIGAVVGTIDTASAPKQAAVQAAAPEPAAGVAESKPEMPEPAAEDAGPPAPGEAQVAPAARDGAAPETAPAEPAALPEPSGPIAIDQDQLAPSVRRLIAERNLDPSRITATGPAGRITKGDVLLYLESGQFPAPPAVSDSGPDVPEIPARAPASQGSVVSAEERINRKPMTPIRQRIASRLLAAKQNTAMLTTFNEIDMAHVMAIRKQYKDRFKEKYGVNLGFMSFFIKACIEALKEFPQINAFIEEKDIIEHQYYHIGVAVGTERGLVVPVVRHADMLSFAGLEKAIVDYVNKIKDNQLSLSDLEGGTFTISNGGVYGSLLSTPILNMPQSGILGMHKIEKRPMVIDDEIVIRPMMYVALSYDHRIVDGREAVTFLKRIKECVENPERIMMEI
jgi:2-oxoglutarate dehydrogenase E2 component (dihydrolipoamide succinyltransferase)